MANGLTKLDTGEGNTVYRFDLPKDPVTVHMKSCLYIFGESTTEVEFDQNMPPPFERIGAGSGD